MPHFFIDRPVFAWVIALFVLLAGALSITQLPVAQYPNIAPPKIEVTASYPGASAQVMDQSVVSVIEQELSGADHLLYFESSSSLGSATITSTFKPGINPELAQVDVLNRLKAIESRLPQTVIQQGLRVEKVSTGFLLFISLIGTRDDVDSVSLSDYLARNVVNEIKRLDGVGKVQMFGSERAMRIWLDPQKLIAFNLTPADVNAAITAQNTLIAAGSLGELPIDDSQEITATVLAEGQLSSPEAFAEIVLRADSSGAVVRVGDVARVELGSQEYQFGTRLNGQPSSELGVQLTPDGNELSTATLVRAKMDELSRYFLPA